ncbi:hypothetical protein YC2023_075352 [Brassica napus]
MGVYLGFEMKKRKGYHNNGIEEFLKVMNFHLCIETSLPMFLKVYLRTSKGLVWGNPSLHGGRRLPWITPLNTTCLPTSTPALLSTSPITAASTSTSPTPLLFAGNNIHMCPLSTTPPSTPRKFKTTTSTHPICPQYPSNTHIVILPLTCLDIHKTIICHSHHAPQLS